LLASIAFSSLALRLPAGGSERLGLLTLNLLVARPLPALEREVLADGVVEYAHGPEA
jgi:hypothetical protein